MRESDAELTELQALLDVSLERATGHLRSIVRPGRTLTAGQLVRVIAGMCTLAVSSVTAAGEPRVSGADGQSASSTMPAATVVSFASSIRMNDPVARLRR